MKLFAASFLIAMNLMLVVGVNLPMEAMPQERPECEWSSRAVAELQSQIVEGAYNQRKGTTMPSRNRFNPKISRELVQ